VDPVPDPLLPRKSGSAGIGTRTARSVTRNSDHQTTEADIYMVYLPNILTRITQWYETLN
jgi:ABC-type proline/glycine betaine transport system permease subunit